MKNRFIYTVMVILLYIITLAFMKSELCSVNCNVSSLVYLFFAVEIRIKSAEQQAMNIVTTTSPMNPGVKWQKLNITTSLTKFFQFWIFAQINAVGFDKKLGFGMFLLHCLLIIDSLLRFKSYWTNLLFHLFRYFLKLLLCQAHFYGNFISFSSLLNRVSALNENIRTFPSLTS